MQNKHLRPFESKNACTRSRVQALEIRRKYYRSVFTLLCFCCWAIDCAAQGMGYRGRQGGYAARRDISRQSSAEGYACFFRQIVLFTFQTALAEREKASREGIYSDKRSVTSSMMKPLGAMQQRITPSGLLIPCKLVKRDNTMFS